MIPTTFPMKTYSQHGPLTEGSYNKFHPEWENWRFSFLLLSILLFVELSFIA